jgi:predicted ATP-binding protein involved in virulence
MLAGDFSNFRSAPPISQISQITEIIKSLVIDLLPGVQKNDGDQNFLTFLGLPFEINHLSDGYRSLMAVLGHLLYHSLKFNNWEFSPTLISGTLLIDEIDLHLHPAWQRIILPSIQKAFPGIFIISTTHSPMVAGSVSTDCMAVLKPEFDETIVIKDFESIEGWRADQILTSSVFDLPTTRNIQTETLIEKYAELLNLKGPNNSEVKTLGKQVSNIIGRKGENVIDQQTYDLLNELLISKFTSLDEKTKKIVLAKAGLLIAVGGGIND